MMHLLDCQQVADFLSISIRTFHRHVRKHLPVTMIGLRPRFNVEDVRAWVGRQRVGSSNNVGATTTSDSPTRIVSRVKPSVPSSPPESQTLSRLLKAGQIYADAVAGRIPITRTAKVSASPLLYLVGSWLDDLAKTYPPNTCKCYREYSVKWLRRWKTLGEVTEQAVAEYTRDGLTRACRSTIRKELAALLGNFFGWLVEKQHAVAAPARPTALLRKSLGTRTGTQRLTRVEATPAQVAAFLAALPELGGHEGRPRWRARDAVILAYETGLRPITIARLSSPEHWAPGDVVLRITDPIDKARFGRTLPLTKLAVEVLARCAIGAGVIFGAHDYRTVFRKAREAAGTPAGFSPYDVRHARGQHLADAGAPLTGIAFLMGHKRLTTTNIYVRPSAAAGAEALSFGEILGKRVLGKKGKTKKPNDTGAKEGT